MKGDEMDKIEIKHWTGLWGMDGAPAAGEVVAVSGLIETAALLPALAPDESRITVTLQALLDGQQTAVTAHADYCLWSGEESPATEADDVSLLGLWGMDGADLLEGEREEWPRKTQRIAELDGIARVAVAKAIREACDADLAEWLNRDAGDEDAGTPGEIGAMGRVARPRRGLPAGSTHISMWGGA